MERNLSQKQAKYFIALKEKALLESVVPTGSFVEIHGRKVELVESGEIIRKKILHHKGQSSAHIYLPLAYKGDYTDAKILTVKPFVCLNCLDAFDREGDYSPIKGVCKKCYADIKKLQDWKKLPKSKKVCSVCKKPLSDQEFEENWCQPYHFDTCASKDIEERLSDSNSFMEMIKGSDKKEKKIRGRGIK